LPDGHRRRLAGAKHRGAGLYTILWPVEDTPHHFAVEIEDLPPDAVGKDHDLSEHRLAQSFHQGYPVSHLAYLPEVFDPWT
jgi:hypothetical protein